jgi:hypothetical protein
MIFKDREQYRQLIESQSRLPADDALAAARHGVESWKTVGVGMSRAFNNRSRIPRRFF